MCGLALAEPTPRLKQCLDLLGNTLMAGIGGSMGPLYGTFFEDMAGVLDDKAGLDAPTLQQA